MATQAQADAVVRQIYATIGDDNGILLFMQEMPDFYFSSCPDSQMTANRAMLAKALRDPKISPYELAQIAEKEFYCPHEKINALHPDYKFRCPECDREEVADLEVCH